MSAPLLEIRNISKTYYTRPWLKRIAHPALRNVSFTLNSGEILGVIGRNESGKSTLVKLLAGLEKPDEGEIFINGDKISRYKDNSLFIRLLFSNANESLNQHQTLFEILDAPLKRNTSMNNDERFKRIVHIINKVGLFKDYLSYYPAMLSSGQVERFCLAKALILQPAVILADESLEALDISVRTQIINLILDLQKETGLALVYVSQNLHVMTHISDRIAVIHHGEIVELNDTLSIIHHPVNTITQHFINSFKSKKRI